MADAERYSFKNLEVWKAAQQFAAVDVSRLVDDLPNTRSADVIGRQLLRSATSVGANIAEGHARYTFGAYRNHLSIAKGSAAESEHWVDLLVRRGLITEESGQRLGQTCMMLMGVLTRRILALQQQEKSSGPRIREDGPVYQPPDSLVPWFSGSMVQGDLDEEEGR